MSDLGAWTFKKDLYILVYSKAPGHFDLISRRTFLLYRNQSSSNRQLALLLSSLGSFCQRGYQIFRGLDNRRAYDKINRRSKTVPEALILVLQTPPREDWERPSRAKSRSSELASYSISRRSGLVFLSRFRN